MGRLRKYRAKGEWELDTGDTIICVGDFSADELAKSISYDVKTQKYKFFESRRRLIAQTPEPLVKGAMLTSTVPVETPAIAESSPLEHVPTLLFVFLALFIGYLFYRCVKARRSQPRPLAYPVGLLGAEAEPENHDDA